nr:glycosyltransferase [Candidatus Dormibacteraeota bacterium]
MAEPLELSVVVPAYNESGRLPETLSVIKPYLNALGLRWELIIVNDGSSDQTMDLIRTERGLDPDHLVGIDLQPNGGKGRAVAAGVAASRGVLVLISDADFSTPID